MDNSRKCIEHQGHVIAISQDVIEVQIVQSSACAACHSKAVCGVSDKSEKVVEVIPPSDRKLEIGQEVTIFMAKRLGAKAVFLGYILPFLVLMTVLIGLTICDVNEGISGLISLAVLVPYYFGLYIMRHKMKKEFEFRLR